MFTGFTKETGEFLWELSFNNERPWFLAHKEQFERCLNRPFRALAEETHALLSERFPDRDFNVHISRIYRDARRLFGRGPYKDHLWFSIQSCDHHEGPSFWFEIGAAEYSYGLGFWNAGASMMEAYRRSVAANPARFARIVRRIERERDLRLIGEEYKRPKGDLGPDLNPWYNRKYVAVESAHDFGGALLTAELPAVLADAYTRLMPLHDYFFEVYDTCRAAGDERR